MSDPYPRVIALLTTAAEELLARHGVTITLTSARGIPPKGRHIVGTIGFGGPHMKGHLAVLADETFWRRVAPPELATGEKMLDETMLADMVGEIANMLLGRFRNAVLPLGADIATAIPTAMCGTDLALHCSSLTKPDWHAFRSDHGFLFIRLHVAFRRAFHLSENAEWSLRPNEADLVLF